MRLRSGVVLVLLTALAFESLGLRAPAVAAADCTQINQRIYGSSGGGGDAARFRLLKTKADQEAADGDTAGAARDRAAAAKLAASILSNAKALQAGGCPVQPHPQSAATSEPADSTPRSPHGCVGFDGVWGITRASDNLIIKSGTGTQTSTTYSGRVNGNVMRGTWSDPKTGHGTFVFTLSDDGDWIDAVLHNDAGAIGTWRTTCVGPDTGAQAPAGCRGFAGRWNTDYGLMTLDAGGSGTYLYRGTSRIAGTISPDGGTLTGTWMQDDDTGQVSLSLDSDGHSFHGTWRNRTGSAAGTWNGTCAGT